MTEVSMEVPCPELTELAFFVHYQFSRLVSISVFLEKAIRKEAKQRRVKAQRKLKRIKGEEERAFNSVAIDDYLFEIERDFPRLVRYSLLTSMMSTTESCLVRLCRITHGILTEDKFNEKSPVIKNALEYLEEKACLNTSSMRHYKDLAGSLQKLRNSVTHADGCIQGRSEEGAIRAFVKKSSGVKIDKWGNVVLSGRFIRGHAHAMKYFIVQLHGKTKKQVSENKVESL